jgi:hypothetical protein
MAFIVSVCDGLTSTQKAVANVIAFHADKFGRNAYPSINTIAREGGVKTRRWVQRVVRQLEGLGVIIAETPKTGGRPGSGRRTTTTYRVNMDYVAPEKGGVQDTLSEESVSLKGGLQVTLLSEERAVYTPPGGRSIEPERAVYSDLKGGVQTAQIELNRPIIEKEEGKAPLSSLNSSLNAKSKATEGSTKTPTPEQAKKLCSQIQAYLQMNYDVALTGKGRDDLLAGIAETPVYPPEVWYFAVVELMWALDHNDNDGFARSQAASRIPATLATMFVPTAKGVPTVVDRYYEKKVEPFIMARQRVQMEKERAAMIAENANLVDDGVDGLSD